jgi:hypothetical protein
MRHAITHSWVGRVVLLLLAGLGCLFIAFFGWQWSAKRAYKSKVAEWSRAGIAFDDASMMGVYRNATHVDGTTTWMKILRMSHWGTHFSSVNELPFVGKGEFTPPPTPSEWHLETPIANYLKEMEPMIALVLETESIPTPVTFPIEFQGYSTLLEPWQTSRDVARILQLECEFALYKKNSARAMRAIKGMHLTQKAFREPTFMVVTLLTLAIKGLEKSAIRSAVATDLLSRDELDELKNLVQEMAFSETGWNDMFRWERAMVLSTLENDPSVFSSSQGEPNWVVSRILPSSRLQLIDSFESIASLGNTPIEQLAPASIELERRIMTQSKRSSIDGSRMLLERAMPAVAAVASALEQQEDSRRMTPTAIALRTYRKEKGTWPRELADLEQIGLNRKEHSTVSAGEFGYQVEGEHAWLWSYPLQGVYTRRHIDRTARPTDELQAYGESQILQLW